MELDHDWRNGTYTDRDRMALEYAALSVIREVIGRDGGGFAVRTDKGSFAAVVSSEKAEPDALEQTIRTMADTVHRFINRHFPLTVSVGISRIRDNWSHLNLSYREAREMLSNKLIFGTGRLFAYSGANPHLSGDPFPIHEIENDILYGIRTRNRTYACESVGQLRQIRETPNIQYKWLQSRLVEMVQSIYRQAKKWLDDAPSLREPTLDDLLALATLEEWIAWLQDACILPIIGLLEDQYQAQAENAAGLIRDYVRRHLETDLRLETCCKTLQLSVSFAKLALKDRLGCSFADLVLQERIEQAKRWLRGGMSVEEIARRLQYSNAQNFSRTFKKAVGVPPGQFRAGLEYRQITGG